MLSSVAPEMRHAQHPCDASTVAKCEFKGGNLTFFAARQRFATVLVQWPIFQLPYTDVTLRIYKNLTEANYEVGKEVKDVWSQQVDKMETANEA